MAKNDSARCKPSPGDLALPANTIITVDGPAAAGKSTISRLLAARLGFVYLDTGAMYRAVALKALRCGVSSKDEKGLATLCAEMHLSFDSRSDPPRVILDGEDVSAAVRAPHIDLLSSDVSAWPAVRRAMLQMQRRMALKGNVVAEGRDMGTVVFPEARFKFFLTAAPAERAARRYRERVQRGEKVSPREVQREMQRRDEQDSRRATAPLRPAPDAHLVDSTRLGIQEVLHLLLKVLQGEEAELKKLGLEVPIMF